MCVCVCVCVCSRRWQGNSEKSAFPSAFIQCKYLCVKNLCHELVSRTCHSFPSAFIPVKIPGVDVSTLLTGGYRETRLVLFVLLTCLALFLFFADRRLQRNLPRSPHARGSFARTGLEGGGRRWRGAGGGEWGACVIVLCAWTMIFFLNFF